MVDSNYYLRYLRASLEVLEDYLICGEIFWPLSTPAGIRAFPKLTLGNLLLAKKKLKAISVPETQEELAKLTLDIEEIQNKWLSAWETIARNELHSRMRQWTHYLNDLRKNEENHAPYFPIEVRVRVLISLLAEFALYEDEEAISKFDLVLQSKLDPSDFIWDPELRPEFPAEEYWYLYGRI